ncbi:hypothetical protein [Methylotenera versatilis]|uniref:Uncharacterized protein n=1 Tax=Methylotenera versatilis (strain 301) TaxID=666681 RepID=D7DKD3_METV0|nr:hypothetical protein [Methylotenera versatilis]ADI28518.1 hypothetical protein M301_0130 [Methylotenera versatilis 301]
MKKRPNFNLHTNETPSAAILRLYKHIRAIKRDYEPQSHFAARIQHKKAFKPILRIVK